MGKVSFTRQTRAVKWNQNGRQEELYRCEDRTGCLYREKCCKGEGDRTVRISVELTKLHKVLPLSCMEKELKNFLMRRPDMQTKIPTASELAEYVSWMAEEYREPGDIVNLGATEQDFSALLRRGNKTINEISQEVGYSSASSFHRAFSRYYGFPPGEFES